MKKLSIAVAMVFSLTATFAHASDVSDVWKAKCKSCHGEAGAAETPNGKKYKVDDITDAGWQSRHSDEKIKTVILEGKADTKMKPYKDKLSEAEIDGLVKLIRTFKK
ncbi:MAG: cytochrome c [Myxococcaceae bacterium]